MWFWLMNMKKTIPFKLTPCWIARLPDNVGELENFILCQYVLYWFRINMMQIAISYFTTIIYYFGASHDHTILRFKGFIFRVAK